MTNLFSALRIILVRPSHPGNIGATARAMKTMGFHELYLVAPKKFPDAQAVALAAHAEDILSSAVITPTLAEALHGITQVYATSGNTRTLDIPVVTPRVAAQQLCQSANQGKVALVFGPENYGLSNEDLQWAHYLITIPTASSYTSLNLAAAVQVLTYECYQAAMDNSGATLPLTLPSMQSGAPLVSMDQLSHLYQRLAQHLIALKVLDPACPGHLMAHLQRLFQRSQMTVAEWQILEGILRAWERKLST